MNRDEVKVAVEGKTYRAPYRVERGIVTVSTDIGELSTQVGGSPPASIARMLLREVVRERRDA